MATQTDEAIRSAAFAALSSIVNVCGQPLTWSEITQGFTVAGEKILFANRARGIFKPARLQRGVLSVKTTVPRIGRGARYVDIHDDSGSFTYRLQGSDPNAHDNRRLRESYEDQSPLIYFVGVFETRYEAIWGLVAQNEKAMVFLNNDGMDFCRRHDAWLLGSGDVWSKFAPA